jgi:hypothetical protein
MSGEHWWPQKGWRRSLGSYNPMILIAPSTLQNCLFERANNAETRGNPVPFLYIYIGDLDTGDRDD